MAFMVLTSPGSGETAEVKNSVSGGKTRSVSSASVPGRDAALKSTASRITKRSVSLESAAGAELEAASMVWSPLHRIEH